MNAHDRRGLDLQSNIELVDLLGRHLRRHANEVAGLAEDVIGAGEPEIGDRLNHTAGDIERTLDIVNVLWGRPLK